MKVVYSVFVAIFLYIYSGGNTVEAKNAVSNHVAFSKGKQSVTGKTVYLSLQSKFNHSDPSKRLPAKPKKRNRKGVKPLLFVVVNDFRCNTAISNEQEIQSKQIPYYFFSFSGNGKRGPPAHQHS